MSQSKTLPRARWNTEAFGAALFFGNTNTSTCGSSGRSTRPPVNCSNCAGLMLLRGPVSVTTFLAACFFAAVFFAGVFFAAAFLTGGFFAAAFFAGCFFAEVFFAGVFLEGVFFDAIRHILSMFSDEQTESN